MSTTNSKDDRDTAFLNVAFPCNNKPFVNRLKELSDELDNDSFKTDPRVLALHHTITSMIFGQLYAIDGIDQYQKLASAVRFKDIVKTTVKIDIEK